LRSSKLIDLRAIKVTVLKVTRPTCSFFVLLPVLHKTTCMKLTSQPKVFQICTLACLISICGYSQKTEFSLNAYSGLFSFRGNGSVTTSRFTAYYYSPSVSYQTYNPHGKKSAFSYSIEGEISRNTKLNLLYGIAVAYEVLSSGVNIDSAVYYGDFAINQYDAAGSCKLTNTFLNINPFFGKRFTKNKFTFDLLAGLDLAFCLRSRENGEATTNPPYNEIINTNRDMAKPVVDFRPRLQFKAAYKKFGILLGYSHGITNYHLQKDYSTDNTKAYTRFFRLGASYIIK